MLKKPQQFEPGSQMIVACDELQRAMLDAQAAISRVNWLKDKLLSAFESMKSDQDSLEIYTESEAAAILTPRPTTRETLCGDGGGDTRWSVQP